MKLSFDEMVEVHNPNFKGGEGELIAKSFDDGMNKMLCGKLEPGSTIGYHIHDTSSEIIYILSGNGKVKLENGEEILKSGDCHYCKKGESHSLINDGTEDLIFFAVVPQQ